MTDLLSCLQIKIEPLADFIESLTDPDHLERIKEILDKASTPFDYYRIDERVNEFYQADLPADAATSWLARNHGHRSRLPNVPIIRELRIDITTLHPSAIYRLEQFRRRQLREKVLPVRLDVFVEEKEPEWIKQRTREKKLARKLEKEKERVRQLLLEEEERQRCAEERERQQVAMVRRHLGISSAKRDRRHSGGSNGSSEMSSVPSNVSSPTPPPTQIFHEVQESVPFPFGTPVQPVNSSNPPDVSVPSSPLQLIGLSEEHPNAQTIEIGTESAKLSETASALNKAKRLPRLKLKFKGLSPGHSSPALPTNGSLVPEEADTRTNRPHGIQEVSADPSNNGLDATGGTPSASRQSDAKAFLSPSGMASNTTPDRPLSTKLTSTTRVPDGGSGIPHAAEEVITHMAILLSEHNTAVSSFQDPAANVDIAVDLAVDNAASSSTVAQFIDEGRLGLTIRPTSNVEDQEDSRSKVAVAAPPLYSAQDEEDEAVVEAMEGLDTVSGSGSSGGFRYNIEAFSSAGSLQKGTAPVLFPELVADAPCGHMTEVHCSNTLPSSEIPSSGQPIPLPETASEHRQHRPKDALGDSGLGEQRSTMDQADLQMPIDDELEPVTYEDTQAGTWKAIYKDFHGNNTGKGKERIVYNKGKERAKDLSLRIRALDSPDSDDHSPWAQSAKVIQVKGITGPTATDTESASVESPDTRSVSPALLPYMAPSPDTQTIEMPTQPNSEPTTLASTAARPSTERRRQNEALYAALAANFLNRCGSTSQAQPDHDNRPGIQAGLASHSLRHSPGSSSRATSDTPSEPYLLQRLAGLTTCDPRDVFGRLETSTATLIGHVKSERDVGPMEGEGEVLQHEVRDGNEDLTSDNEMLITEASVPEPIILSSELKDNTVLDLPQPDRSSHSDAPSSARSDASRPVLIEEEEDPEMKGMSFLCYVNHCLLLITSLRKCWEPHGIGKDELPDIREKHSRT